jgi:uncharacterized membrane protein YgcG
MGNVNLVRVRNKMTTEIRDIDLASDEWLDEMSKEVTPAGFPKWEQVGEHQARAIEDRAESGTLRPEDLGSEDQEAYERETRVQPADVRFPSPKEVSRELFPQERDAGIESHEDKVKANQRVQGKDKGAAVLEKAARKISSGSTRKRRGQKNSSGSGSGSSSSSGSGDAGSGSSGSGSSGGGS